jgi:hypothetical protein
MENVVFNLGSYVERLDGKVGEEYLKFKGGIVFNFVEDGGEEVFKGEFSLIRSSKSKVLVIENWGEEEEFIRVLKGMEVVN